MSDSRSLGAVAHSDELSLDALHRNRVEEFVRTLGKAVRAHQLYEGSSPVYERFVESVRQTLHLIWTEQPSLPLEITETRIFSESIEVYHSVQRSDNLAFLFFRDGIRQLMFLPGFEGEDLERFLALLARVHRSRDDQDDLITLLWEQDLAYLQYRHVDVATEGLEIPVAGGAGPSSVDPIRIRSEVEVLRGGATSGTNAGWDAAGAELPVAFQEALYFLDDAEMRLLREQLHRELRRDMWTDVIHGLVDRLEDGAPERQLRIVRILTDVLPSLVSGARIGEAAVILREFVALADRKNPAGSAVLKEIRSLFDQLADPDTVREMVRTVEDSAEAIDIEAFSTLLGYFPRGALAPLIAAAESVVRPEVRRTLSTVIERLAARDPGQLVRLLSESDPALVAGAARLVGRSGMGEAAPLVSQLLARNEAEIRLAAVAALQELRVSSAAGALQRVLDDPERDVRIAAARALGSLRYTPARSRLQDAVASRRLRDADVTERIAFFEAFGSVAGAEGVSVLARLLTGRNWLGRREPPEIRACAALALGRIRDPDAMRVLQTASEDPEPVVRAAVTRSLRGEGR
ncbi:hypothetical protein BH23GEM3_BH23GEM3_23510 [soil metagenome]|nr:HEAT repeat domain-containing protein [Gemmatimonadota bacterium]